LSTARAGWSSYFGKGRSPPTLQNHGDASIHGGGGGGGFRQIGAKYPALLFKQQLDACMGKVFPMLRDNIKKDINTPLAVRPCPVFCLKPLLVLLRSQA
jgi:myosin-5